MLFDEEQEVDGRSEVREKESADCQRVPFSASEGATP